MNSAEIEARVGKAKEMLVGYPAETVDAAERFFRENDTEALDRLVAGVIAYHRPAKAKEAAGEMTTLEGSARLVEDLGFDSLAMVEMSFLLDELLGLRLSDDEMRALRTIDDVRGAVRMRAAMA
jgi:Acyl carrier protein